MKLTCALLIGGIAIATAYSQNKDSEYVAPPDAGPKGKAPRMKVQLLNPGEPTKQYAVIFYQGDEALSGMLEFAQKHLGFGNETASAVIKAREKEVGVEVKARRARRSAETKQSD